MNLDTPLFRAALTIAAVWFAISLYLAYSGYQAAYRSPEYAAFDVPAEQKDPCFADVTEWSGGEVRLRKQTHEETQACLRSASEFYEQSIRSSNEFAFGQAWQSVAYKAVLPAAFLLAVAAFWSTLLRGIRNMASGYISWLRFGSRNPEEAARREDEN